MSFILNEQQLIDAGFAPTMAGLPFEMRSYEKPLPSGNLLHLSRPGRATERSFAVEWCGKMPVNHYWLYSAADFYEWVAGQLAPIAIGK